ncbi:hypothetical protein RJC71_00250 [Acinetobacter baumannii]|uniref:hypothetical protein n=1 Tax=Acinetobacter baumannii TaxID=470 RepID=UPI0028707E3D|nr:hypothetical protein [Acinetobacter baumannii]MDR9541868.1 hypothetical protein [Acinetobacter baumannii]
MTYLSCKEIYELMTELGYTQTNTREYAHEFELKNGQYFYIKRLKDSQKRKKEPSRLMIHPSFLKFKEAFTKLEKVEFSFEEKGNMNSTFAEFPKCDLSKCDGNPTEYGIGVNFKDKLALINFLKLIENKKELS